MYLDSSIAYFLQLLRTYYLLSFFCRIYSLMLHKSKEVNSVNLKFKTVLTCHFYINKEEGRQWGIARVSVLTFSTLKKGLNGKQRVKRPLKLWLRHGVARRPHEHVVSRTGLGPVTFFGLGIKQGRRMKYQEEESVAEYVVVLVVGDLGIWKRLSLLKVLLLACAHFPFRYSIEL